MANAYDDVELTPRGMRALAHPVRVAILNRLQSDGPSTATTLAPLVGATPSVTSWHLRHLAEHGLVIDADVQSDGRQRWWQAVGRGFRFVPTADDSGREAATLLERVLFDQTEGLPGRWANEVEPLLEDEWRQSAGLSNTSFVATAAEVAAIESAIEHLLAPYVLRKGDSVTVPGARVVRMLRYVLPEAPHSSETSEAPPVADS